MIQITYRTSSIVIEGSLPKVHVVWLTACLFKYVGSSSFLVSEATCLGQISVMGSVDFSQLSSTLLITRGGTTW